MNPLPSRLLVVTDRHQARSPLIDVVTCLLEDGLRWLWLRDRDLPTDERRALALTLLDLTRRAGAVLSIGADIDLAAEIGATGVHLRNATDVAAARRRLGDRALLGVSAHCVPEVRAAAEAGADYATLSPLFASPSKPGYGPALGLAALREAARANLPAVALGGVTAGEFEACLEAGAGAVATMGPAMRGEPSMLDLIRRS